jgi:hypothetical protein
MIVCAYLEVATQCLTYFGLVRQTVEAGQLGQLGEAAVVDAEMQVLVQHTEILIAAPHNPAPALAREKRSRVISKYLVVTASV